MNKIKLLIINIKWYLYTSIFKYINNCKTCKSKDICEKIFDVLNYKNSYSYFKTEGKCIINKNKGA